jgi:nitrate reductase (cytochrome)
MSPVDRRTFVQRIAGASAAVVAGPALAAGELLQADAGAQQSQRPETVWRKAPCTLCGVGCGLLVAIEGGRATAVRGDPDSPVSRGLACARGYHSVQALYGRDRLIRARVRSGDRVAEAPIGDALDLVARRIRETIERHGRGSVALYASAEGTILDSFLAAKLFRSALGGSVDSAARVRSAGMAAGLESTFGLDGQPGCYDDVDQADVFVLWDANIAETDPVLFSRMLERRRKNRAVRIVDVTTRTTRTSYAADQSLLHAPYSGLAIANAIAHTLVARRWVNRAFVDRNVAFRRGRTDLGGDLAGDALIADTPAEASFDHYVQFLASATPERVQRASGLPADRIRLLASLYGDRARKVVSIWNESTTAHTRGAWLSNALFNLHLLTGKIGTPGNTALCLDHEPGGGAHRLVPSAGAGSERSAIAIFRALERGDIRFLWVQGSDPLVGIPNADRYRQVLASADRFIVASDAYPTATTYIADVVLPSALWIESEGVVVNSERRVQHFERMVAPPGEATSVSWQVIEVARRLGLARDFPWEQRTVVDGAWSEYARVRAGQSSAPPPLAELRSHNGLVWPYAGGRAVARRYSTREDPAADRSRGDFHFYGNPDGRATVWLRPYQPPAESPDREFPFWLSTGRVLEHAGTDKLTRRVPTLHRAAPRSYAEFSRDDARQLGIRNGDQVRLVSRRGSLVLEARVEHRSQPARGHVFVPSFDETLPVQRLMSDAVCPVTGQPQSTTCTVRVERVARPGSA